MLCSANELAALLRKACVGVGLPVGLAQDAAEAAVWLETRGVAGCIELLGLLHEFDTVDHSRRDDSLLWRGPSMVDALVAQAGPVATLSDDAAMPLLFAGYLGVAAAVHSLTLEPSERRLGPHNGQTAIDVPTTTWEVAAQLAARTYVPATEESRLKGAGAGLTDND